MAETMLVLGDFVFGVDTAAYQSLSRTTNWVWAAIQRAGGRIARQAVGYGDDRVTITGVLYPTFKGKAEDVEAMRTEGHKFTPLTLIDQAGYLRGKWVIESIVETQSEFLPGGGAKKIEFTMTIASYGEDAN